jgi:hypothetical protein
MKRRLASPVHWAEMTGPGFGQGGTARATPTGKANGPRTGDGFRGGGFRNGDESAFRSSSADPATD